MIQTLYTSKNKSRNDEIKFGVFFNKRYERILDTHEQFSYVSEYLTLYDLDITDNYKLGYVEIDKIISHVGRDLKYIKFIEESLNIKLDILKKINKHLIDNNGGQELIKSKYSNLIDEFMINEMPKLGINVTKYSNENVSIINNNLKINKINKKNIKLLNENSLKQFKMNLQTDNYYNQYLHPQQIECIERLVNSPKKCLINMWCGTGKTRTFTIKTFIEKNNFTVFVFPSLGLINQYNNDYILNNEKPFNEFNNYKKLSFCSDNESKLNSIDHNIKYTTEINILKKFIKNTEKKIVLITYQSFEKFVNYCVEKKIFIDRIVYDESHHIVGEQIQDTIFNNDSFDDIVNKSEFWTATPVNKNGITMYNDENNDSTDCGPCIYKYMCYQAIEDKICKPIETQICLYTRLSTYDSKYQAIFEIIIRACLSNQTYNYWNALTYHSFVNKNDEKNEDISFVKDFASNKNKRLIKKLFTKIQNNEYPNTKNLYNVDNFTLCGVSSDSKERKKIIDTFNQKVKGRIMILASCGILNEGIDTDSANMAIPINPSQSIVKESQRIGRIMRKTPEMYPGILLVPCYVDINKYQTMDTSEKQSDMIRREFNNHGNFNTFLNVLSALKYQYQPDMFEMILKYPNMFSPKEIKNNLSKQGYKLEESQGDLIDNINYLIDKPIEKDKYQQIDDKDLLKQITNDTDLAMEIHTQNMDLPIETYGNSNNVIKLFHNIEEDIYYPIKSKNKEKNKIIPPRKRSPIFNINVHSDLNVLWKIDTNN